MQIKRLAALSLAAILATTMLTACPWDKEGGNSDDDSQITTDENRPGHTGSDDNDDSDDTSDDDDSKVTITEDENGNTIEKGDGYTRTETPDGEVSYTVTNAAGLLTWASEAPAESLFSVDCTLLEDIDMAGYSWTPVGTTPNTNFYNGTFDGNGKCIENLHVESDDTGGLFAYAGLDGCIIKNLTLNNATISGRGKAGGIVGVATSEVSVIGCTVTNSTITATNGNAGGIAGQIENSSKVIGCMVSNSTIEDSSGKAGGIVGFTEESDDGEIIACCFVGNADKNKNLDGGIVGGISVGNIGIFYPFYSCYWSGQPDVVADIWYPTNVDGGTDQPAPDNYTGAYKIGEQANGKEVTWSDAVTAMNSALSGYECSYTANGNNPPTLNTGTGSAANQLAGRLGLSWPF